MAALSGVSLDKVTRYTLIALVGYTGYRLAAQGSLGAAAQKMADEIAGAWGGSPLAPGTGAEVPSPGFPGTPAPSGLLDTSLTDLGGVPVVYNTATRQLQQSPSWVATYAPGYPVNSYPSGTFKDAAGGLVQYLGSGQVRLASGEVTSLQTVLV